MTSTGWKVYQAKLPHEVYFLTKGEVRLKTSSKKTMIKIVGGGDYGDAEPY